LDPWANVGRRHTLFLDADGAAYSTGSDRWLQLGHGETWKVAKERDAVNVYGEMAQGGGYLKEAWRTRWITKGFG
jgi:alpha-tubulin suppressor-like RCC1 family protein